MPTGSSHTMDADAPQRQRTLRAPVKCSGIGVHTGTPVTLTMFPAAPGHGIRFRRVDLGPDVEIAASWDRVVVTNHCTMLGQGLGGEDEATVMTVEHLMSAFAGLGVDNALVLLDGPEVPIMDGSSAAFVFLIDCAGLVEQDAPRRAIEVLRPVTVEEGNKVAQLLPQPHCSISFAIDFPAPAIGRQSHRITITESSYRSEIARARTFGMLQEVDYLRKLGLARGGSLENAIVVDGDRILNPEGLRFTDEFVRHKILDCLGDLYLAGAPILGHVHGERAGHAFNNRLLHALFADPANWRWVEVSRGGTVRPIEAVTHEAVTHGAEAVEAATQHSVAA
ncbi:MAG: UDP-3-O-acyl-N-acetylglucosamine deacetylase [Alphaproteobacteria bacterium]|nr:MAG: UDP-3-O-acyl-N-acetylglucosamine deacetylase [Alphaproteobacteria bacterium]